PKKRRKGVVPEDHVFSTSKRKWSLDHAFSAKCGPSFHSPHLCLNTQTKDKTKGTCSCIVIADLNQLRRSF
ncbi:hypothetical protein Ancab_029108, partial [Ancistrocladus abbreviatus]